jgi:cell division protein FtsN
MADYKNRASSKKKSTPSGCGSGFFFLGGLVAGAFLMGLAWLKLGPELTSGQVPGMNIPPPTLPQEKRPPPPKPNFEFYTILPEMEVVIPDEEVVTPDEPPNKPKPRVITSSTNNPVSYILQMGSFRRYQDADRLKARLALIGIEAEIQKVSINNRDTYHRVRSRPYTSQSRLNAERRLAKENGITSLVIKLKR